MFGFMRDAKLNLILLGLIIISLLASFMAGAVALPFLEFLAFLRGDGTALADTIFGGIRAPRIALAIISGFALGLGGAAVQGLLRNPLAEPGLLGASNAAALGAVMVIYLGLVGTISFIVPLAAAAAALISVLLLIGFAGGGVSSLRLILAGLALSTFCGAGISLALNLSPNVFAALEISFWLLGAVENRSWLHVGLALPCVIVGCALMLLSGRALDALSLGEEVAASLGLSMLHTRLRIITGMALAVGGVVAVTGVIGFIGLLAPHFVRPYSGHLPSRSLWASGLMGALLLLWGDTLIRLLPTPIELKLGVVTAFFGVPMLFYLLARKTLIVE